MNLNVESYRYELYDLIFSNQYDAIYSAGNKTKWDKRRELSQRIVHNEKVEINPNIMPTDGKNLRRGQLQSIANSFGILSPVLPDESITGYIQELVNNRNYIAHGDKTPEEVGKAYSIDDLKTEYKIYEKTCNYLIDVFQKYIEEKDYLKIK